jgi:hypothetical protein
MKNIGIKLAAVAFLLAAAAAPAIAGKGGSAANIKAAVASTSVDAIIAEVERSEHLSCSECLDVMTRLTADSRYPVREVAAWWFTKRPAMLKLLQEQFNSELTTGTSLEVRNAADFLGASISFKSLPQFRTAIRRELTAEAKLAIVRAVKVIGNIGGNDVLTVAMTDADPKVRAAAVTAWRDIRNQPDAAPAIGLLADPDSAVRADEPDGPQECGLGARQDRLGLVTHRAVDRIERQERLCTDDGARCPHAAPLIEVYFC